MTDSPDSQSSDPLWDEGLRAAFSEPDGADDPGAPSVLARIEERIGRTSRVFLRDTEDRADAPILDLITDQKLSSTQRYQVLGEIARGGIGVVLQGRDTNLGRDVALKVLRDRHRNSGELIQRFVEEAQIGGQLQHPGIVPVYDLGLDGDRRPFFTMKLVKGRTLAALLAERKDVTERGGFFSIFVTICQTIAYAHSRGVIHRDLKPANVMVGAFGEVQVMDWGFAKVLAKGGVADETLRRPSQAGAESVATVRSGPDGSASFAGSIYGTPAYMPPEQAQGGVDRLDERADVFALGSILCEILTGDPPYRSHRDRDVIEAAAAAQLDDAYERLDGSGADPELIGLARRCLQADLAQRPRNAGSVAEEMSAYLATVERRATEARVEAAAARVRVIEERKSRRLAVALVTSLAALIALVAIGAWWIDRRSSEERTRREQRVSIVLKEGETSAARGDWPAANLAVERAVELVASGEVREDIRRQVSSLKQRTTTSVRRLDERDRLEDLRLQVDNDPSSVERAFERVLTELEIQPGSSIGQLDTAMKSFDASTRIALASALDDWALRRYNRRQHSAELGAGSESSEPAPETIPVKWIVDAAKRADPDRWRGDLRDAALTGDVEQLRRLADSSDYDRLPPSSLNLLGLSLCAAGEAREGIAVLSEAFDRYPESFWINLHLSRFYRQTSDVESATRHALIARSLQPNSSAAWLELALLEMQSGEVNNADAYLAKAEELSAEGAQQRAKWAELLARTRTERESRWTDNSAQRLRMRMGMRRGGRRGPERGRDRDADLPRTIQRLEALVAANETDRLAQADLGHHLLLVGDLDRAESLLAPLMDTGYRGDVVGARAEVLFGLGKYDEALRCAQQAVAVFDRARRDPGVSERLRELGALERCLRAAIAIERALGRGEDVGVHDPLLIAIVAYQTGDTDRADRVLGRTLDDGIGFVWPRTDPRAPFTAACAAVAAGLDSGRTVADRRVSLAHARKLLQAGFTVVGARTERFANGFLRRRIGRWRHDVRLAPTRDRTRLADLGETEIEAWRLYWRSYQNLLTRIER